MSVIRRREASPGAGRFADNNLAVNDRPEDGLQRGDVHAAAALHSDDVS